MLKVLSISLICVLAPLYPASESGRAWAQAPNKLEKTASDVIAATLNYRATLERVLVIYERELARRAELSELRQDLFEREVLSKREFEEAQRAQAEAQKNVDETRAAIAETERMATEARIAESVCDRSST